MLKIFENFTKIEKEKSEQDKLFIVNSLKEHFIFSSLNEKELYFLAEKMFFCKLKLDEKVIN